jgi:hypothetical protein
VSGSGVGADQLFEYSVNRQVSMLSLKLFKAKGPYLSFSEIELYTPVPADHTHEEAEEQALHWSDSTPLEGKCTTVGGAAKKGTACNLPFTFRGTVYHGCTREHSGLQPWCYTGPGKGATAVHRSGDKHWVSEHFPR